MFPTQLYYALSRLARGRQRTFSTWRFFGELFWEFLRVTQLPAVPGFRRRCYSGWSEGGTA
jgi:hypothetical protein